MGKHFFKAGHTFVCLVVLAALLSVLPAFSALGAEAQQGNNVSGTVTSASDGQPLIGVGVMVKGTTTGTITDFDGKYTITAAKGQTLVFSYIGFTTVEVVVGDAAVVNVTLEEDSEFLDEVVVIGYGTEKKKLVTGSTVQVKGENIAKLNSTNPLQAMQGQAPGVTISSTSGQPGSDMKVIIRGLGTVGDASPLYLIDGVGGDISTVNPADIESIDVLKDAASAAIYGAQAANGVVLVTTKHGKAGKAKVTFDGYFGVQSVARKIDMLNAEEYMTIMDEQALNSGNSTYDWSSYDIYDANGNVYDTDWIDQMFEDGAIIQSYSVGVSGGTERSTYALSVGYLEQEGIVGGSDVSNYERYNFRLNADQDLTKWLKVGESIGVVYNKTRGISVGNQYNNSLRGAFAAAPITRVWANNVYSGSPSDVSDGTYDGFYGYPYYATSSANSWWSEQGNPYGSMMINNQSENRYATFTGNFYGEVEPIENLKFRSQLGLVYATSEYRSYSPLYYLSDYDYNETMTSASQSMNHGFTYTWTNTLTYNFTVGEHTFTPLLGMEVSAYEGTYLYGANGYLKDGFDSWEYAYVSNASGTSADEGMSVSGSPNDESKTVSYFARLGWNFKETYMVNATIRADGSSRFASGHRFGYFPSVSAGWTMTNENFMDFSKNWLDFLKIRASWGQVGNQNIDNYQYLSPIQSTYTHYNFGTGLGSTAQSENWGAYASRLANEDLTWETSEQTNLGLDARFFQGRLNATFDWYWKTTKDWLVEAPILATAGTGAPYINGGDVKNYGWELAFTWSDQIGKDFSYSININGAWNHNEVGNIPTEDGIIHGTTNMLYDNSEEFYRAENGHAIGYFWGYKTCGIFQNETEIEEWIAAGNGVLQSDVQPGDVKYVDVNHDGVIDEDDRVDLGNGIPDYTLGLTASFQYKDLDFSVTCSGAFGQQIVQSYRNHANKKANYTSAILDRWTGEGTSNKIPRVTESNINWEFSDLYVHNGNYLRVSNVTLGYDFANLINLKNVISQCRLYFQVQNLFTFTKYDGMDPEIGYGTDDWVSGIDVGYYPRPRTILVGLNLKF